MNATGLRRLSPVLLLFVVACATVAPVDLAERDVTSLQAAMQRGELTSQQLVEYYLERIEAVDRGRLERCCIKSLSIEKPQVAGKKPH